MANIEKGCELSNVGVFAAIFLVFLLAAATAGIWWWLH
jgi:hypothetical protein